MALTNSIRIIGGRWRGRKLGFSANATIRPTLDQIRETLFNWLQTHIHDARCLDAFAGSGALGIEALSRGAKHVTFIDQHQQTLLQIKKNLNVFDASNYDCLQASMPQALHSLQHEHAFDIIFLDPPFNSDLVEKTLVMLENSSVIKPSTVIYFETDAHHDLPVNDAWQIFRMKKTKHVAYGLLLKNQISNDMT